MFQVIKQLQKTELADVFIVFDSIKNFMAGGDRDKNKDVSKVLNMLKTLRARGATVLFLHHTNKPQKDLQELVYAGSSAFQEDGGNAYILQKNKFKNTFVFKNFKAQTGELQNIAFTYNSNNHTLNQVDFLEASETQEIVEMTEVITNFLQTQTQKPSYTQIMQHLQKQNYSRNKANKALRAGKNRYWKEEKLTQNNKSVYFLISLKSKNDKNVNITEIEYKDENDKLIETEEIVKNSSTGDISGTSPTLGLCEIGDITVLPVQVQTNQINMPII